MWRHFSALNGVVVATETEFYEQTNADLENIKKSRVCVEARVSQLPISCGSGWTDLFFVVAETTALMVLLL